MANFYNDNKDLKFHLSHPLMKKIVSLKEKDFVDSAKFDYAPVDFEDAMDSYEKTLEIVGEICGDVIDPNAESVDKEGPQLINNEVVYARGTQQNHEVLTKAGLIGMSLPRMYDGLNFPMVPYVMAAELVSRADAGFANIWGLQDCAETMHEFASEELKAEFLPRFAKGATAAMVLTEPDAGSDLQAVQLKGKQISASYDKDTDTYFLNGVKRFITNGDADISLVLARSEEDTADARGLSLFVYDREHKAVKIRRIENKLGIKGSPTCEMVFTNAPAKLVGDRKMGLIKYVMSLMNSARLGIGAQSVGLGEAAYREAVKYAKERVQFGKAIIEFPAVYEMLRMMDVKNKAMRTLLYETARYVDVYKAYTFISEDRPLTAEERQESKKYQKVADVFTPLLKLVSSEYANSIAYDSLQIHGGAGFMKDFPIERIYRDARITSIYEGTSQLQVVAAIRGVSTGAYLSRIQEFDAEKVMPELEYLKKMLQDMTSEYQKMVDLVNEKKDPEYLDFHARRLVEMAGNIIMGYLLLQDTVRDEEFKITTELFIRNGRSENKQKADYIMNSEIKDLGIFKFQN
ncbi:MAG: acyl-CoA dehydrogenase family protein [Bacteroidales bacterium]|nr:acyl-CoA dehydrogenase family protein [Bacteroidales bacterium]MCF8390518.1 acyl-CoA dehydrogenase family protein [Bacteroidales bacterium]